MRTLRPYMFASLIALSTASGCTTFQAATEVESGRSAFLIGDHQTALGYFERAAQTTPNYVRYSTALQENVWSYVGRAEYAVGRLDQARRTLETAVRSNSDAFVLGGGQNMARLYLGLTLLRSGERQRGLHEVENGMRGLYDDIEYVSQHHRFSFGQFWDPRREIRSSIEHDLAMLSRQDVDLEKLIADGEWLGKRVEEEIDRARRDEVDLLLEGH